MHSSLHICAKNIIAMGQFTPAINIINWYGSQESRQTRGEVQEHWNEIMKEIISIEAKGETLILLADANRHLGSYVEGNHPKTSFGGKLILDLVDDGEYVLVNATNFVINGPFTHYNLTDSNND